MVIEPNKHYNPNEIRQNLSRNHLSIFLPTIP